ncbi:MAG: hypothetical protein JRN21_08330 [Nitrososphaerota archaeon]|nr:hypothetical protein [Nitrososphaerota archaeon]
MRLSYSAFEALFDIQTSSKGRRSLSAWAFKRAALTPCMLILSKPLVSVVMRGVISKSLDLAIIERERAVFSPTPGKYSGRR